MLRGRTIGTHQARLPVTTGAEKAVNADGTYDLDLKRRANPKFIKPAAAKEKKAKESGPRKRCWLRYRIRQLRIAPLERH